MLILASENKLEPKYNRFLELEERFILIDYDYFVLKTMHLLQLTCSAIFNFVFCVRSEGLTQKSEEEITPVTLYPKKFKG